LAASARGGRWSRPNDVATLYTSKVLEGALAEIVYHWSQLSPLPSKPVILHTLKVSTKNTLRISRDDLSTLGIDPDTYATANNPQTQAIGAAVAFLECDGLIAPSARWDCDNLAIFTDHHGVEDNELQAISSEEIDWQSWARDHGLL
jgi:hypothetical protein